MSQCALAERTAAPVAAATVPPRSAATDVTRYENSAATATRDDRAFDELHTEHRGALYGFLVKLTGDWHRAEDLVQETMVRAWRHFDTLDAARPSARPWLLTVGRRLTIDAHRARTARPQEVRDEEFATAATDDDPIDRHLTAMDVRQAVQNLNPAHRDVLVEMYFHGLSVAECAEKLGIPEGTVKSRSFYALKSLRQTLEGYNQPLKA
jgi:RNA polymerase sigma-70 factor, ECF subfamily